MCALFGFLDYGKRVPWRIIQKLVQALANASEVRGHHANVGFTLDTYAHVTEELMMDEIANLQGFLEE